MTFRDLPVGSRFTMRSTQDLYRKVGVKTYVYASDTTVSGVPGWRFWTPHDTHVIFIDKT